MNRAQARQRWIARFRAGSPQQVRAKEIFFASRDGRTSRNESRQKTVGTLRIGIEELEFRGVGRLDQEQVSDALRAELQTLIGSRGVPSSWSQNQFFACAETPRQQGEIKVDAQWLGSWIGRKLYDLRSVERR
jgi:hypothetical protein